jgi:hypothetical protein
LSRENLPTQIAAQLFKLVHLGLDRRGTKPDDEPRLFLQVNFSLRTQRARITMPQTLMGYFHSVGASICIGAVSAVPFALFRFILCLFPAGATSGLRVIRGRLIGVGVFLIGLIQYLVGFLSLIAKQQPSQAFDGGILGIYQH